MLAVPEKFSKNAFQVRSMGSSGDTGAALLKYMGSRLGLSDFANSDILDFGCGCRFAEAIVNKGIPVKSYLGIDVDLEMIAYLQANAGSDRLGFCYWNARNPFYNPDGAPISLDSPLPVGDQSFDVVCMF